MLKGWVQEGRCCKGRNREGRCREGGEGRAGEGKDRYRRASAGRMGPEGRG